MKVDVIVLTKNSGKELESCLNSVYENIPVNRIIAVDGYSTDDTLEILHKFDDKYHNIVLIQDEGTRGRARQMGIEEAETEWLMFVDSDVILCKEWFKRAVKQINDAGAVWGVNVDVVPDVTNQTFLKMLIHVAKEIFEIRGGMHDTLILKESVKDIKIPDWLHIYEDKYIIDWIKKKGYEVVTGDDLYCLHYRPPSDWDLKESINLASLEIRYGLVHFHGFRFVLYYPFYVFFWFMQSMKKNFG